MENLIEKMNRPIYYQNYHKHTSQSHRYNKDSPLVHQDYFNYIKNNCSDVPQIYSTVEHGWQGVYFRVYNDLEQFNKKNNLNIKFVFGTEMYWVKNRFEKDNSNCHIILLAKNDNGRKAINKAISIAYKTGYYYKGRMDIELLLSLPKDDVFVTTACVAFWNKYDDIDDIVLKLNEHFSSFYLEVQPHLTEKQKELNQHILDLHNQYNIPLIAGTDSHIIDKSSYEDREDLLRSNKIHYDDEDGWFLDYPSVDEFIKRFETQGILNQDEIYEAINNTNIILSFEDIILDRTLKVPVLKKYQNLTQEQRNRLFINTLRKEWMNQQTDINKDKLDQYVQEIKHDIKEILDCNMADYFLDNYEIIKRAINNYGGILTPTGRGSGVSMYLNKLLGFTKVDKVNASVLMYSERFLTATRVKESHTPPDIDHNVSEREPFIQAQRDLLGEKGTYDLIALGTLKYKSAFKMYARAYDLDPQIANEVSSQITKYEEALKYAEDEEDKELISIYDYVDKEKYSKLIEGCKQYKGIVDNIKGHPCFVGETLVLTQSGYKQIKDISVGENVFTHNGRLRTVLETTFKETNEILNVNIMGSPTIKTTSNHPFFVTKRRKHGSKDILLPYWKEAGSLSKGDLIGIPINNESEIPTIKTINTNNENFWWIIGRYIGDGWRSHTIRKSGEVGKKVKEIIICCNKNNNELNEITKNIEGMFNYWISKERTVYKIKFHNIHLYNYLDRFGDYAYGKKIPSDVLNLPINLLRSFLKGYFSADGYFNEKGNEQCITTVSKELAIGIIACINKAYKRPCSFTIKALARKEMIEGRIVSCKEQYSVRFHYDERKQDGAFYNNNFLWMPFRCSEKIEQNEIVYNLSVNEDNSYTVNNLAVHNCGTICSDRDIESDIGVIMCKSETTGKETLTAVIESGTIDSFGYLKQDYLVVDSIGLMYDIYKEMGIKPLTINQLTEKIENNQDVWDIYKNGKTICINQCEQEGATKKVMKYQPHNISELTQFIAAIRPSFKTMYKTFENRQPFEYGIKAFDTLLQDEYCHSSFILYQESLMKVLGFAGFPMSETYTIIKAISKKKDYIIKDAKKKFIPNFMQAILKTKETDNENQAKEMAEKVWQIIENSAQYGFNCVSGDTIIKKPSSNGVWSPTVEEMWLTLNDKQWAINNNHKSLHNKYKREGYGYGLSMKDGNIYKNKIIDIYRQKKAQTYTITTESGKKIKATSNHKFPTNNGIKIVENLTLEDSLYCMGSYKHINFDSKLTDGNFEPNPPKKGEQGFQKKPNGDSVVYDKFRENKIKDNNSCEICGKQYSNNIRFEVHHKDFDRTNNQINNYQWVCVSCHKKEHYKKGRTKQYENGIPTYLEKIISIEPNEVEVVYDVSMSEDIAHNFVTGNNIVTCNSAHAYSMALDSVTLAWQKANYPLEFYKVTLQRYTNKGNKNKVNKIKKEMIDNGIKLNPIKFGDDNRKFTIDEQNQSINQTMASIKGMSKNVPDILYRLKDIIKSKKDLMIYLSTTKGEEKINSKSLDMLFKLNYFKCFGDVNQLIYENTLYNKFYNSKVLTKSKLSDIENKAVQGCFKKESEKQYREIDNLKFIENIIDLTFIPPSTQQDAMVWQIQLLGYTDIKIESASIHEYMVESIEVDRWGRPWADLYNIKCGVSKNVEINKRKYHGLKQGDIIKAIFGDKHIKKFIKQDEYGKNIYEDTGKTRRWVTNYEKEGVK